MEKFNPYSIEDLYKHYKHLVGLNAPLEPHVEKEIKRAFMGGLGQLFILIRSEIVKKTPEEAGILLEGIGTQIEQFWNAEAIQHQPNSKTRKTDD